MTPPRFQYTIRGLLWATFWAAVGMGAWGLFIEFYGLWRDARPWHSTFSLPTDLPPIVKLAMVACFTVSLLAPFLTIGALFGRTVRGLLWGLGFVAICYVL